MLHSLFNAECVHALKLSDASLQIPNECPQDVADLIKDCMKSVPEDRPTTREIFHRLRKCSKPRDSGGKGSTTYPGHGTGSSGGTGGSLPANQVSLAGNEPGLLCPNCVKICVLSTSTAQALQDCQVSHIFT